MPRKSKTASPIKSKTTDTPTKSGHLKWEDHELITSWLHTKSHYEACFGAQGTTSIGQPPKSKINGYQLMAIHLKAKTHGRLDLTPKQMSERFKNYRTKYRKAHTLSCSTGFGVTDEDCKVGIVSVAQKLDSMCPFYAEMDTLFGSRANITPLSREEAETPIEENPNQPRDIDSTGGGLLDTSLVPYMNSDEEWAAALEKSPPVEKCPTPPPKKKSRRSRRSQLDLTASELALDASSPPQSPNSNKSVHSQLSRQSPIDFITSTAPEISATRPEMSPPAVIGRTRKPSNLLNINNKSHMRNSGESGGGSIITAYAQYKLNRDSEKNSVAWETLQFEKDKFNQSLFRDDNRLAFEKQRVDSELQLEEKKMEMGREEIQMNRIEREKDRELEKEKLQLNMKRDRDQQKHDFVMLCLKQEKNSDEIEHLVKLLFADSS